MRKRIFGRRLKRNTNQRKALFKSLMRSLVLYGKIKTTKAKAMAVKGEIEKLVTAAKKNGSGATYYLRKRIPKNIADRIISDIAPKFADRAGGYTRLINTGSRIKDNAPMVLMEWVEPIEVKSTKKEKRSEKETAKTEVETKLSKAKISKKDKKDEKTDKANKR